jgi:hypothetical protein
MSDPSLLDRAIVKLYKGINKIVPWHKLPTPLGVFNLLALRIELRAKNLYDVYPDVSSQGTPATCPMSDPQYKTARNSDGKFNSLQEPKMGCAGMRFGRNVPRKFTVAPTEEELMTPNPRVVSERLLARQDGKFKPATIVNLLAAAWIQFQVHDWVFHYFVRIFPKRREKRHEYEVASFCEISLISPPLSRAMMMWRSRFLKAIPGHRAI